MASSPTKHAELMGMGIPVICNDIGDTGGIINDTKTGFIIDTFNEDSYQDVINRICDLEKIGKEYIYNSGKNLFDLRIGVQNI